MDMVTKMRLQEWAEDYADQQASGLTQKDWCAVKGISVNTFAYRCRCVRRQAEVMAAYPSEAMLSKVDFVPITAPSQIPEDSKQGSEGASPMKIHFRNAMVEVTNEVCVKNLRIVLEVLSHAE